MTPSDFTIKLCEELNELYELTCQYVKEHQGEKGYIDTQDDSCDYIYALNYNNWGETFHEHRVRAVKYDEKEELLFVVTDDLELTEEDIKNAKWLCVDSWNSDNLIYLTTLWSIADNIEEYVE